VIFVDLRFLQLVFFFSSHGGVVFACFGDDMFIFHHTCCGVVFAVILCLSEQVEILGFFVALGLSCAWTFDIFPPSTALGLSCARGCLRLPKGDL
jgi:hypothetical protein